ncbi:MAG: DUF4405 domain-containing protein [Alistipes sp.]|nr:DUF4405 domain-containing protein [Alistipes sp.]
MKKMTVNIVIDVLMLVATSLLSFSGFLLEGILPHCHGKGGVLKAFLGMGRHTWADIHLYSGIALVVLLVLHVVLHWSVIDGFFRKTIKNSTLRYLLYLFLLIVLVLGVIPWLFAL